MKNNELITRVTSIFRETFDNDSLVISAEMNADSIDEWDSLTHIRLIVSHEIEFGVKFSISEVNELENIGDFIKLLESKIDL
ncbi:acyl carrier protein [bacterium]|jgi:acyl carrier protein|nr:acyl carrier protein [bacterium]